MLIKLCGLQDPYNITDIAQYNLDYAGFIFVKDSPRFIGLVDDVSAELSFAINALKKAGTKITGVFKNPLKHEVELAVCNYALDAVQLHGDESPELCLSIGTLSSELIIIKAVSPTNLERLNEYSQCMDYFLFDTPSEDKVSGGTGKTWDLNLIAGKNIDRPYFIAGGVDIARVEEVQNLYSAGKLRNFAGFDVNSSVEVKPGFKNSGKVNGIVKLIREYRWTTL